MKNYSRLSSAVVVTGAIRVNSYEAAWVTAYTAEASTVIVYIAMYHLYIQAGITLPQNFWATSRLRPGDLERCFNKQGDTRLHVAAVLTR